MLLEMVAWIKKMKKLIISLCVVTLAFAIFDLVTCNFQNKSLILDRFIDQLYSSFELTIILWISDQYWNHFKAPKTEMLLSVSAETFQKIQTNKCIELPDGKKIELQETNGKLKGLSPWNFNTWRSRVEIVFIDAHDQIVNLRCKTRSINKIQIFDFGYNTRFLDSISKSLT